MRDDQDMSPDEQRIADRQSDGLCICSAWASISHTGRQVAQDDAFAEAPVITPDCEVHAYLLAYEPAA
jgi:xanthine dehydrogenase iron-sulfur cluster and FAD-binding subunit A